MWYQTAIMYEVLIGLSKEKEIFARDVDLLHDYTWGNKKIWSALVYQQMWSFKTLSQTKQNKRGEGFHSSEQICLLQK